MKVLKNSRGFTLVEIMVAAGLLGVLAMGMNSYMSNAMRASKKVEQNFNALNLKNVVLLHLSNTTACANSFLNGALTATYTTGPRDIRIRTSSTDQANNTLIQAGQIYGEGAGRLRINSIRINGFTGAVPVAANMEKGEVSLEIETAKINPGSSFGANTKTEIIKLGIVKYTNSSPVTPNQFVKCFTSEDLAYSGMCSSGLGGLWDPTGIPSCESVTINARSATAVAFTANTAGTGAAIAANGNVNVNGNLNLTGTANSFITTNAENTGRLEFFGKTTSRISIKNSADANIISQLFLYETGKVFLRSMTNSTDYSYLNSNRSELTLYATHPNGAGIIRIRPYNVFPAPRIEISTGGITKICSEGKCQTNFGNNGYTRSCSWQRYNYVNNWNDTGRDIFFCPDNMVVMGVRRAAPNFYGARNVDALWCCRIHF